MSGFKIRFAGALAVAVVVAALGIGCGGGSDSSESSSPESGSTTTSKTTTSEDSSSGPSKTPPPESSSSEPSREFLGSGRNGKLAKIGKESSVAEREAASVALEKNLNARATGDWATQCATLAASAVEQIEKGASVLGAGTSCPKALEAQAAPVPAAARASTMTGPIDAFRINQGINGFAFYHGTGGKDYVIPMIKQGGEWKVVTLQEEEIR
jgi:hypothetical protein